MNFIARVRALFQRKEFDRARLPRDWPSDLHSKCDSPTCFFPNPPQAAEGTYNCQGFPCCSGTYHVSEDLAARVIRNYSFGWSREAVSKVASTSTPSLGRAPSIKSIKSIKSKTSSRISNSKHKHLPAVPGLHIRSGSLSSGPNSPVRTLPPSTPTTPSTASFSSFPSTPSSPTRSTRSPNKGDLHAKLFTPPASPIPQPIFGGGRATVSPVSSPTRDVFYAPPARVSTRHQAPRSAMKRPYPARGNASAPSLNML